MGAICSLCYSTRKQENTEELVRLQPLAKPEPKKTPKPESVLDPQSFDFVDALHLPRETSSIVEPPSRPHSTSLPSPKRNSLTSWLANGLFTRSSSKDTGRDKSSFQPVKMLMSGTGESGKSTIIKQMKIIHQGGFTMDELIDIKPQIYRNVHDSMLQMLNAMDNSELSRDPRTLQAVWNIRRFKPSFEELDALPEVYISSINFLWVELIRNSFERISKNISILDSAPYFFDEFERISRTDYIPTNEDVLRARLTTTGIAEYNFKSGPLNIKMIDVGGQRPERRKWIETFDNVTTLIFCVAISEYDQVLREEPRQNRLLESFQLWETVINSKWFLRSSIVLFLNKKDIFRQKLKTTPLHWYFPEYRPLENPSSEEDEYENATEFLKTKFLEMNYSKVQVYPYLTCATDTRNIDMVFAAVKETILANNLRSAGIL